jgi:aquaporin Z
LLDENSFHRTALNFFAAAGNAVVPFSNRNNCNTAKSGTMLSVGAARAQRGPAGVSNLDGASSLRLHWPEYLMEAGELGCYMFLTCAFATLLHHPASPVRHYLAGDLSRRALMGLAMGATVIAIILSPWGKQSGAHCNPAITLTFYRLGKVRFWDALFYGAAQFLGAISGVAIARVALHGAAGNSAVRYAATVPGLRGNVAAFVAELSISLILMTTILVVTNRERLARYTPYFVGTLVAIYLTFEAPLSGMSMNPARTFGSALHAGYWRALWIYFIAPQLGMLVAAEIFLRARGGVAPFCAKLHHANNKRCIFHHGSLGTSEATAGKEFNGEEA